VVVAGAAGRSDFDEVIEAARAGVLPFESWERLIGESPAAFAAFCVFRDFGGERNIKRALASLGGDAALEGRRYNVWRNWSMAFRWAKRAADYDLHLDRVRRGERVKSIEARELAFRAATERMLCVVQRRLDLMQPEELSQGNVVEWMKSAIDVERMVLGVAAGSGVPGAEGDGRKQLEIRFTTDFEGV